MRVLHTLRYALGITFWYPQDCDTQQPFGPRGAKYHNFTVQRRDFSPLQRVQESYRTHHTVLLNGYWGLFPWGYCSWGRDFGSMLFYNDVTTTTQKPLFPLCLLSEAVRPQLCYRYWWCAKDNVTFAHIRGGTQK